MEVLQLVRYQRKQSIICIYISFGISAGKTPTLPLLRGFPVKDSFIDIAAEIANDYKLFGTFLLEDENGHKVKNIEKKEHGDPTCITDEILQQWLQGKGRTVTWQTLIVCLKHAKCNGVAKTIEENLA